MNIKIIEGLEVDTDKETPPLRKTVVARLGPINVSEELKDMIETLAFEEGRSISNTCIRLIERGLKYVTVPGDRED
jgi:hypothetical protein